MNWDFHTGSERCPSMNSVCSLRWLPLQERQLSWFSTCWWFGFFLLCVLIWEWEHRYLFFRFFELILPFVEPVVGLMGQTQQHLPTVARLRTLWVDWDAAHTLGDQGRTVSSGCRVLRCLEGWTLEECQLAASWLTLGPQKLMGVVSRSGAGEGWDRKEQAAPLPEMSCSQRMFLRWKYLGLLV